MPIIINQSVVPSPTVSTYGFPGVATFNSLVDEIIGNLRGYAMAPDQITTLTNAIGATDARIKVDDVGEVSKGVIEIGTELVYVKSTDEVSNDLVTNVAWRGYRGTLAEAHPAGATVTYSPTFARATVLREINNVLLSLYPMVFGVKSYEFTPSGVTPQYDLPVGASRVMDVNMYFDGYIGWERVRKWDVRQGAGSPSLTGVTIDLYNSVPYNRRIRVTYATAPVPLVNLTDVFTTVTGLPESAKDIITFGVMWRLAQNLDLARLPLSTVEADELATTKALGSAIQVGNTFFKLHTAAIDRERKRLNELFPARIHLVR